jgi:hypothetical protein
VFDFAENLIAQQRAFAKQMFRAAGSGQQAAADADIATEAPTGPTPAPSSASAPSPTTIQGSTSPES